jgi:hypothetical protein
MKNKGAATEKISLLLLFSYISERYQRKPEGLQHLPSCRRHRQQRYSLCILLSARIENKTFFYQNLPSPRCP